MQLCMSKVYAKLCVCARSTKEKIVKRPEKDMTDIMPPNTKGESSDSSSSTQSKRPVPNITPGFHRLRQFISPCIEAALEQHLALNVTTVPNMAGIEGGWPVLSLSVSSFH